MYLINTRTITLFAFPDSNRDYAILSHTWGSSQDEVTFQEMIASPRADSTIIKPGYQKILKTCEIARDIFDLEWAWVNTCCIDKSSSAELSEAINSMFRWYKDASICFAYLSDTNGEDPSTFRSSRWFERGWTLQELISPNENMIFYDCTWTQFGTKATLGNAISDFTGISALVLDNTIQLEEVPVAVRMSWAATRKTTREEDIAYSLLGIFDVNMPMLYGEGRKAFMRLQEAILGQCADLSLFLWSDAKTDQQYTGLLAPDPSHFQKMKAVRADPTFTPREFYLTNGGIRLKAGLAYDPVSGLAILPLNHSMLREYQRGIYLQCVGLDSYVRVRPSQYAVVRTQRYHKTFTAAKALTKSQSSRIASNALKIVLPKDILISGQEPQGAYVRSQGILCPSYTGAFLGYMMLQEKDVEPFALVYCFRNGHWLACVVAESHAWERIRKDFYSFYRTNTRDLTTLYNKELQIGLYDRVGLTAARTVHVLRGDGDEPASIYVRTIDTQARSPIHKTAKKTH